MTEYSVRFRDVLLHFDAALETMIRALEVEQIGFSDVDVYGRNMRDRILKMDDCAATLFSRLHRAQTLVARSTARARRASNSRMRIHSLPPEILEIIILFAVRDCPFDQYYKALFKLAGVSSYWKIFVENTRSLWTKISSSYTRNHVENILKKSGNHTLVIELQDRNRWDHSGLFTSTELPRQWFADLMHSQIHRCKAIGIRHLKADDEDLLSLATDGTILEYLSFADAFWSGNEVVTPAFSRKTFPLLKGLLIDENSGVRFFSGRFASLRLRSLRSLGCTISDIHNLLRNNVQLMHMSLENVRVTLSPNPASSASVSFPHLSTLLIGDAHLQELETVLASLETPSLKEASMITDARLTEVIPERNAPAMLERVLSTGILFQRVPNSVTFTLGLSARNWTTLEVVIDFYGVDKDDTHCRLEVSRCAGEQIHPRQMLQCVQNMYPVARPHIFLDLKYAEENEELPTTIDFYELHHIFPQAVSIQDWSNNSEVLCNFLSMEPNSANDWPLPHLRYMSIAVPCDQVAESAWSMVQARYGGPSGRDGPPQLEFLNMQTRFEELSDGYEPELLNFKRFLGEDRVFLNRRWAAAKPSCWSSRDAQRWFDA